MLSFLLIVSCFLVNFHCESVNNVIVEYFKYKKVTSFIGITCFDALGNKLLINNFNKENMSATTHTLDIESNVHLFAKTNYWKLGILVDTRCYSMNAIALVFDKATEYRIFDELRSWLILSRSLKDILKVVNDKAFGISTDFVIAVTLDSENFQFYDVYNIFKDRGAILNITSYGIWRPNSGLQINLTQPKIQRRANFHQLILKATFYKSLDKAAGLPVKKYYDSYDDPLLRDWHSALGYKLLSHISNMHNFTLLPLEAAWERGDNVGPIARTLANFTVDFSGTPITMTVPRTQLVKFVHQNWNWNFRSCFFFRNPQTKNANMSQLSRPLAAEVWYLMVVSITTMLVVLSITQYYTSNDSDKMILSNSFIIILGALCQQGAEIKMAHLSFRIAFLCIMIFSLLIYDYYSASIVSVQLNEPILKINNSLNQLGKLNLKMASENTTSFIFYLKKPGWDSKIFYEKYWKKLPESQQFMGVYAGMQLVQKGGFAYQSQVERAYLFIGKFFQHREMCEIMEVDFANPTHPTFAVTLNSTFTEIARVGFMKIAESGLRKRYLKTLENVKPMCRRDVFTASGVTVHEFAPHLFILLSGILIAVSICVTEIIIVRHGGFRIWSNELKIS